MSKTKTKPTVGANAPLLDELQCAIEGSPRFQCNK